MTRIPSRDIFLIFFLLLTALAAPEKISIIGLAPAADASAELVAQAMDHLPLSFVPNAGQRDGAVHYEARAMGGDLYFTEQGVVLALPVGTSGDIAGDGVRQRTRGKDKRLAERAAASMTLVRVQFAGANAHPRLEPRAALPGVVGGYLVKLSSERDTSVVMQAQVPDSNASTSYAATLEAGKTTTLIVGMAPDEDGVIQVGLAPFQYLHYLPAING